MMNRRLSATIMRNHPAPSENPWDAMSAELLSALTAPRWEYGLPLVIGTTLLRGPYELVSQGELSAGDLTAARPSPELLGRIPVDHAAQSGREGAA